MVTPRRKLARPPENSFRHGLQFLRDFARVHSLISRPRNRIPRSSWVSAGSVPRQYCAVAVSSASVGGGGRLRERETRTGEARLGESALRGV